MKTETRGFEVDPVSRTTGAGFIIGDVTVPTS
jgi:hypothetical protein